MSAMTVYDGLSIGFGSGFFFGALTATVLCLRAIKRFR